MVLPGIYTKEEQKMLAQWDAGEQEVGWLGDDPIPGKITYAVSNRVATKHLIMIRADAIHDPNPLWRDDKYARQTRWGSIIAPPFFELVITFQGPINFRVIPPEVGVARTMDPGAPQSDQSIIWTFLPHWEFFKPIRAGDSFRVWYGPNKHEDKTNPDGKGPRTFLLHDQLKYFNQKDELVAIKHKKHLFYIVTQAEREQVSPLIKPMPELEPYRYTQEELDFIDHIRENEIIQGSKIRWWDDVKVGEDLQPITNGPTNVWDMATDISSLGIKTVEAKQMSVPPHMPIKDPETGVWHNAIEIHLSDKVAKIVKHSQAVTMMSLWEAVLGRLLTNWMGDDGFLKKTAFDRMAGDILGDTIIGRGRVIKKYIQDNGEHVVDIACWLENMRGYISKAGTATVGLLSRESIDRDLMRY